LLDIRAPPPGNLFFLEEIFCRHRASVNRQRQSLASHFFSIWRNVLNYDKMPLLPPFEAQHRRCRPCSISPPQNRRERLIDSVRNSAPQQSASGSVGKQARPRADKDACQGKTSGPVRQGRLKPLLSNRPQGFSKAMM
jgi:hypothetical protein